MFRWGDKMPTRPLGMKTVTGIPSTFINTEGKNIVLPSEASWLVEDASKRLYSAMIEVFKEGGEFLVSSMWRSPIEQQMLWYMWKIGKKKTYSPPAGYSMHEFGMAIDLDVRPEYCKLPIDKLRVILAKHHWFPIVNDDEPGNWHFEYRSPLLRSHLAANGYISMLKKVADESKYRVSPVINIDEDPDAQDLQWS